MTNPGLQSGETPERVRAMQTSVERLHAQAQHLIDELGPSEPLSTDEPNDRRYDFSPEAIKAAGFKSHTKLWLTDVVPDHKSDDQDYMHAQVTLWLDRDDGHERSTWDTSLIQGDDGVIEADKPARRTVPSNPIASAEYNPEIVLLDALFNSDNAETPNFLTQAECDQWLKLIKLEMELQGA